MDFSVHSLASGSSGNSTLIQSGSTRILIDAGLPALQIQKLLSKFRLTLSDIDAVFLTHEHGDHSRGVFTMSKRFGVPVIANPATLTALSRESAPPNWRIIDTGDSKVVGDLLVESFPISHDAVDPVGYNIYHRKWKVSFLTDTGVVSRDTYRKMEGANLAIIESNHDVDRLINGPYPQSLKDRILSEVGHLSNKSAADLILHCADSTRTPSCIWLAHLSETNNSPRMARRYAQGRLSEAGCGNVVLDVALPNASNLVWRAGSQAIQMSLFSYTPD
ncbi:MAG: MBL fold metallo-hydrolase [Armatimonadota bacterium]